LEYGKPDYIGPVKYNVPPRSLVDVVLELSSVRAPDMRLQGGLPKRFFQTFHEIVNAFAGIAFESGIQDTYFGNKLVVLLAK
jgi:hypothetical protein